jgi:hypothetical protein
MAHWIAEDSGTKALKLQSTLLAFHRIHGSHTGRSLAKTIMYLLDRAGITANVNANSIQVAISANTLTFLGGALHHG